MSDVSQGLTNGSPTIARMPGNDDRNARAPRSNPSSDKEGICIVAFLAITAVVLGLGAGGVFGNVSDVAFKNLTVFSGIASIGALIGFWGGVGARVSPKTEKICFIAFLAITALLAGLGAGGLLGYVSPDASSFLKLLTGVAGVWAVCKVLSSLSDCRNERTRRADVHPALPPANPYDLESHHQ